MCHTYTQEKKKPRHHLSLAFDSAFFSLFRMAKLWCLCWYIIWCLFCHALENYDFKSQLLVWGTAREKKNMGFFLRSSIHAWIRNIETWKMQTNTVWRQSQNVPIWIPNQKREKKGINIHDLLTDDEHCSLNSRFRIKKNRKSLCIEL